MESPTAVAVLASVLGSTVKLAEKGFEICAVDEQARGLLQMVQQVGGQLDDARALRRQNSGRLTDFERRMYDNAFRRGEDAIRQVASLTERPRVDMQQSGGQISMNTRTVFILRNSQNLNVSLTQLGIASQGLDTTILQLNGRDSRPSSSAGSPPMQSPMQGEWKPPPAYDESLFLSAGRRRNIQRRATALGLATVGAPPNQTVQSGHPVQSGQPVQPVHHDRSRTQSASTLYIPAVPSIPELIGDDSFQNRNHHSLPIIRVANAPQPPSDPIVIEHEPIESSPARSPSSHSLPSSPPGSPPMPTRFNSVSSNTNSDPGPPQSSTFTPPQTTGIQTPPNSWAPDFQEPRPPPANYAPNHPSQQRVAMPVPADYSYPPYPNSNVPHTNVPPIPPQSAARNPWGHQQIQEYRPSSGDIGSVPDQEYRPYSGKIPTSSSQDYGQPPGNLAPSPNIGIGISSQEAKPSTFAPYSPDFQAPLSPQVSESNYVYTPSIARRGQGGRHRHHSLMESRARV